MSVELVQLKGLYEKLKDRWEELSNNYNLEKKKEEFLLLEKEREKKGFWNPKEDKEKFEKWNTLSSDIEKIKKIESKFSELETIFELLENK